MVQSLQKARFAYASSAAKKADYDLAASLLDPEIAEQSELLARVEHAKHEQEDRLAKSQRQHQIFRLLLAATFVLMVSGALVTLWLRSSSLHLANTTGPAMHESMSLQSGLRRSQGALGGWVALGEADFKADRSTAWEEEIRPALMKLEELTMQSGTAEDKRRLAELKTTLDELYLHQWWIEDVAQRTGNEPARGLLLRDIVPIESPLSMAIESLRNLEAEESRTDGGESRVAFTELEVAFARCHHGLIEVVEKGDDVSRSRFDTWLNRVESSIEALRANEAKLSNQQQALVRWLHQELNVYRRLSERALELRQSDQANVAQWRLKTQAIPASRDAERALSKIVAAHQKATEENARKINRTSMLVIFIASASAIGVILAASNRPLSSCRRS